MKRLKRKLHKLILFLLLVLMHQTCYAMTNKECIASVIYHEARGEPEKGQLAVAGVLINRAKKFHTSVCFQLFRKGQFSFVNHWRSRPIDRKWYNVASKAIKAHSTNDYSKGSMYFIHERARPLWRKKTKFVLKIGKHCFYKEIE